MRYFENDICIRKSCQIVKVNFCSLERGFVGKKIDFMERPHSKMDLTVFTHATGMEEEGEVQFNSQSRLPYISIRIK